jgi:hypothetical protein
MREKMTMMNSETVIVEHAQTPVRPKQNHPVETETNSLDKIHDLKGE